jgi:hypothetical protein
MAVGSREFVRQAGWRAVRTIVFQRDLASWVKDRFWFALSISVGFGVTMTFFPRKYHLPKVANLTNLLF